jgi:acyl carrier protein
MPGSLVERDWRQLSVEPGALEQLLIGAQADSLIRLVNVPNERVRADVVCQEWLVDEMGPADVDAWRRERQPAGGVNPEWLWEIAERLGWQACVRWSRDHLGDLEVLFWRRGALVSPQALDWPPSRPRPCRHYATNPLRQKWSRTLLPELRSFLQRQLPEYMVPVQLIAMDSLPVTVHGKIDRRALPAAGIVRPDLTNPYVAPRTARESELSRLWSELLGVPRIGVDDNFFELGGHSLLATQLVSRVQQELGLQIPLRRLFEAPTIAGLAAVLESGGGVAVAPPITPARRDRPLPLSFAQQRLWFIHKLAPDNPYYNIPFAVRISGPLDKNVLRQALVRIMERHEALRTTFRTVDGQGVQHIHHAIAANFQLVDCEHLPVEEREPAGLRIVSDEAHAPFDLEEGPLIRAKLIRLHDHDHLFVLNAHHIISDGWSTGILLREISVLYAARAANQPDPLPPLTIQYADFAVWQRNWFQGEVLESHLAYWRDRLQSIQPLRLATDRPRPREQTYAGAAYDFRLSSAVSTAVSDLSKQEGATPFMTLLAAFKALLLKYTAQEDIAVGSGIANRNHPGLESLVGFFVNMLVLRSDLSGDPTFLELLSRVRDVCLGAYDYQDLPFEKLVQELQPERDLRREPLVQVVFELQNFPMATVSIDGGLRLQPLPRDGRTAKFDLTWYVWEESGAFVGFIEYNTDLFDRSTVARMFQHYATMLTAMTAHPTQHLSQLSLLSDEEQSRMAREWASRPAAARLPPTRVDEDVEEGIL